ncbi:hypothetical protein RhiirC2_821768 [Rhizophagus irregularis]|uniref:Uncharacterized protein n=1 Tax=Rhizophagus irregularis TaxID=588596 RepID=A0A2N1NJV6_9GLOM|nr:hypothetical protein RhiirC2_821768 [Rhizophagus irregularis]
MDNMDNNLCYDRQLFTMNYSQPTSTHSYNSFNMTTNESLDFSIDIAAAQPITQHQVSSLGNVMNISDSSCNTYNATNQVTTQYQQTLPVMSYLKFYHFYVNIFYLVTCKIILQEDSSFNNHDRYSHEFFYKHPNDPSTRYHVTCKSLPNCLVENILNDEICGMNFDVELLSLNQKFNLEQSLKQKLFHRMHCNTNTNSFYNGVVDHEMITQLVSVADIQDYNDSNCSSKDHTHQDTIGLKDNVIHSQQDDFNTFALQQNNFETTH